MKKIAITLLVLMASSTLAMQQQQQKEQTQEQKNHKKNKKERHKSVDNQAPQKEQDPDLADLMNDMAALMQAVNQEHGSVTNMIEEAKKAHEHERICPTCGQLAATCPEDQSRIARGIIMTCGCAVCGGLQI